MMNKYEDARDAAQKLHRVADQIAAVAGGRKVKWNIKITFSHDRVTPGLYEYTLANNLQRSLL